MESKVHIGKLISDKLAEKDRSMTWLAKKVYKDPSCLCKMLKRNYINTELLLRISLILEYDFFACYSNAIKDYN
jgi:hypothetical protein